MMQNSADGFFQCYIDSVEPSGKPKIVCKWILKEVPSEKCNSEHLNTFSSQKGT